MAVVERVAVLQRVHFSAGLTARRSLPDAVAPSRGPAVAKITAAASFPTPSRRALGRAARSPTHLLASKQTFSNFDDLVNLSDTVLVDFYALWCGPCQLMNSVLQDVSKKAGDNLRIVKIDTEKYPELASQYKVEALPTFILFYKGKAVDRLEGAITADKLLARIDSSVAAASIA